MNARFPIRTNPDQALVDAYLLGATKQPCGDGWRYVSVPKQIVLRVETPSGKGPYSELSYCNVHLQEDVDEWVHPSPVRDGMVAYYYKHFGFHSRTLFERWFNQSDRQRLARAGFVLATYAVADTYVEYGRRQCAFERSRAVRVTTEPLTA